MSINTIRGTLARLIVAALIPAAVAHADFISSPLDGHAGAIPGFTGHQNFLTSGVGHVLNVRVDYAVFAPGDFTAAGGVFTPFGSFAALDPTHYVYAYQAYNNGPLSGDANPGNAFLSQLGIDTLGPVASAGHDLNFDPAAGDVNATFGAILSDSFMFRFASPQLAPDWFSAVLLVSSPYAPTFMSASVLNGGTSSMGQLPAPVPLPSAAVLQAIGLAAVLNIRWGRGWRRRNS